MEDRYYLHPNGAVTRRMHSLPHDEHIDIAREVLAPPGFNIVFMDELYDRMFELGYTRIVECGGNEVQYEKPGALTPQQEAYLQTLRAAGKTLVKVSVKR